MEIGEAEENKGDDDGHARLLRLVIIHGDHICHSDRVKTHRSSSSKEWLDGSSYESDKGHEAFSYCRHAASPIL